MREEIETEYSQSEIDYKRTDSNKSQCKQHFSKLLQIAILGTLSAFQVEFLKISLTRLTW